MDNINKFKISVIMSAKDSQSTIADSISSILLQTYENLELLIMDDASTDKTSEIISKFVAKDNKSRCIKIK